MAHRCDMGGATHAPVSSTGLILCGGVKPCSWVIASGRSHGITFGWADDGVTTASHLQRPAQGLPGRARAGTSRWRGR